MAQTILTKRQKNLLDLLFSQSGIKLQFYLSGGTALAEYYLHHRYSEDLDFFSLEEFDPLSIQVILKKISANIDIQNIDFQQSFNRNLFFLHFENEVIKAEFTYYPFSQIEKSQVIGTVSVDSLVDIAVNKAFTLYQNPRSRDFIDLYLILRKKQWSFSEILKKARIKFDTNIDPLQLGQQLLQVKDLKDYPRMIQQLDPKIWQQFWLKETRELKKDAIV